MPGYQIAFASDENYVPHMGCAMASILLHAEDGDAFHFFILDDKISLESRKKLESLREIHDFEISFRSLDVPEILESPFRGHVPVGVYSRLSIPTLLPEVDRLIYMDSDMIATTSLRELWETDLEGKAMGVVPDIRDPVSFPFMPSALPKFLGRNDVYFNAGMMLLDLTKIRRNQVFQKAIQWYAEHVAEAPLWDQDSLNVVCRDDIKILPYRWNIQTYGRLEQRISRMRDACEAFYQTQCSLEGIIHYIGPHKPWHYAYFAPAGRFYLETRACTPWQDMEIPIPPLKMRIRLGWRANRLNRGVRILREKLRRFSLRQALRRSPWNARWKAFGKKWKCRILGRPERFPYVPAVEYGLASGGNAPALTVSLTTYPARIPLVIRTLDTLLRQTKKPNRIVLWLAEEQFPDRERELPPELLSRIPLGVSLRWCENLRSYTKLLPSLREYPNDILVTADDDIYYPEMWLEILWESYLRDPESVHCHRARQILWKKNGQPRPYQDWPNLRKGSEASHSLLPLGVGGVLYPPRVLAEEVFRRDLWERWAPHADDLWFWAMETLQGTTVRVASGAIRTLWEQLPNNPDSLFMRNQFQNDVQFENLLRLFPQLTERVRQSRP
ncbi:MAG: glycosyltransferase family 8 protein [Planctomycetia bacterium]|nr:glycosyltransferase family 8 protein [Planctomycetia bacterium]